MKKSISWCTSSRMMMQRNTHCNLCKIVQKELPLRTEVGSSLLFSFLKNTE
jgi:hypothetical protein